MNSSEPLQACVNTYRHMARLEGILQKNILYSIRLLEHNSVKQRQMVMKCRHSCNLILLALELMTDMISASAQDAAVSLQSHDFFAETILLPVDTSGRASRTPRLGEIQKIIAMQRLELQASASASHDNHGLQLSGNALLCTSAEAPVGG